MVFQVETIWPGSGFQRVSDPSQTVLTNLGCHSLTMAGVIDRGDALHRHEIPPGTLYLLILRTLARAGEMHGYEIANSIQRISQDVLQVEEGSLYPALQRMLIKGWVTAKWGTTA